MEDFDEDFCQCPCCSGFGFIDCHCGGDLCVCENNGERDCPLCYGDGEVSEEIYRAYEERQRENARLFAEARAKIEAEKDEI
jgi:hypothetical protein